MNKYIITFGSGQLQEFLVSPNNVALIIEANTMNDAREIIRIVNGINNNFCTSYDYSEYINEFINVYRMREYTLQDLEAKRIKR